MKKLLILLLFPVLAALFSCSKEGTAVPDSYLRAVDSDGEEITALDVRDGVTSLEIKVEATSEWKVSAASDGDWISTSVSRGNKYAKLTVTLLPNYSGAVREGSLTFSADGLADVRVVLRQESSVSAASMLRVMTFNIRVGGKADGSTDTEGHEWTSVRKQPCLNMFADVSPDVAMLQECRQEQLNDLQTALGSEYDFYFYAVNGKLKEGAEPSCTGNVFLENGARQVIMLRKGMFEVQDWGRFFLSETPDEISTSFGTATYKITLWLKVLFKNTDETVYLFDTHFVTPSRGDVIAKNAQVNVERIKSIAADGTVLFGGDFNCDEEDTRLSAVRNFLDCARTEALVTEDSATYTGFKDSGWKRLDHLFSRGARPLNYKVVSDSGYGTRYISDHFPVYCDFAIGG